MCGLTNVYIYILSLETEIWRNQLTSSLIYH